MDVVGVVPSPPGPLASHRPTACRKPDPEKPRMAATVLDTHRIVRRLRDAGASEQLAETFTDVLRETRELDLSQLATKADIALVRADIDALRGSTKADIDALRRSTKADIDALRAETKADIALLRADIDGLRASTKSDLAEAKADLRREIAETKAELIRWVVGVGFAQVAALIGAVFTIVHFLPGGAP